jgi:hypothetical protein
MIEVAVRRQKRADPRGDVEMIDVAGFWAEAQSWIGLAVERARSLQPALLVALVLPLVVSLLCRSLTAFVASGLAGFLALLALRVDAGPAYAWGVAAVSGLAGLLSALLALFLHRAQGRSRQAAAELQELRQELDALREKHEREVQWRQAGERLSGKKPSAVPS